MKNILELLFLASFFFAAGCTGKKKEPHPTLTLNTKMLDSIKQHSDSTYEKPYNRTDWVTAEYFISKKDSTITQIMKDSFGAVRQIIIEKAKRKVYVARFYPNGQQQLKVKLDAFGQYDGDAELYRQDGSLNRTGVFKGGTQVGPWKNYDENGSYTFTQEFDENGQEIDKYKE